MRFRAQTAQMKLRVEMELMKRIKLRLRKNSDKSPMSAADFQRWTDYSFVKPLRDVIYQLTGYPTLTEIYKILSSIAVT